MTILKRCLCGKFKQCDMWAKPDNTQLMFISTSLANKQLEIKTVLCDSCIDVFFGIEKKKRIISSD